MSKNGFGDLGVMPEILNSLNEMGFKEPTEIQEKAIPIILKSENDFVGQAQTGTGKTGAFVIPLLQKIDFSNNNIQALILTPTRELAHQVEKEIQKIGKGPSVKTTCVYGGTEYEKQISALRSKKPQIVVGTPGRVIDLIEKRILKLDKASYFILDEADEMLNMGFFDDVQVVLEKFKSKRQIIMFSATMPKQILNLIKKSFNNPNIINIEKKTLGNEDIDQKYFIVREKHFKEALARVIEIENDIYAIVFCRTKLETKVVADDLKRRGHLVDVLNGDMGQADRDHSMRNFKNGKVHILVCTDVAARGIDVSNISHVFNYGLPRDTESYVHRIGRTGRAGMKGKAFTIIGAKDVYEIKNIERYTKKKIELAKLPTVEALKQKVVELEIEGAKYIIQAIKDKGEDFRVEASFELFKNEFSHIDKDDLLKMFFVWKFNKKMRHLNNLADIEETGAKIRDKPVIKRKMKNNKSNGATKKNQPRRSRNSKYGSRK